MKEKFYHWYNAVLTTLVLAVGLSACSSSDDDNRETSKAIPPTYKVCLKNEQGQETNTFKEGENIIFSITVDNSQGSDYSIDSYTLFALHYYDNEWYHDGAINTAELYDYPKNANRITAFAVYTADSTLVGFPMDIIYKEKKTIPAGQTAVFECPWMAIGNQSLYSSFLKKVDEKQALPAGHYFTCITRIDFTISNYPDLVETRIDFTVE